MYNLPKDIQYIIYQYDNTYKIIYDQVLNEFNKYLRMVHICKYSYLFKNDLHYNVNTKIQDIFHFIKYSKISKNNYQSK